VQHIDKIEGICTYKANGFELKSLINLVGLAAILDFLGWAMEMGASLVLHLQNLTKFYIDLSLYDIQQHRLKSMLQLLKSYFYEKINQKYYLLPVFYFVGIASFGTKQRRFAHVPRSTTT
jgi:hypothetical protein